MSEAAQGQAAAVTDPQAAAAPAAGATALTATPQTEGQQQTGQAQGEQQGQQQAQLQQGQPQQGQPQTPEAYNFTVPEGMELDTAAIEAFTPVAKELGLNQEQAQKVVSLYADMQAKQADAFMAQVKTWGEEAKADQGIGGAQFDANVKAAQKAIAAFGGNEAERKELIDLLDNTGLGNHKVFIRLFSRIGKTVSEDSMPGSGNSAGQSSAAQSGGFVYPSMKQ